MIAVLSSHLMKEVIELSLNIDEISLNIMNYLQVVKSVELLVRVFVLCR